MAPDSVKSEVIANRTRAASIAFGLAAIPALFLPLSYIFMCGWAVTNIIFPATSGNYTEVHPIGISILIVMAGYYGTLVQWPFYLLWAAFSKELNLRLKLLWVVILVLFNMFAIPYFLYCKYRGITKSAIINNIGVDWLRQFFDANSLTPLQDLQHADYKRHNIRLTWVSIIFLILLSCSIYWNLNLFMENIFLRSTRNNWAELAGSSLANKDFLKGQIGFYQIDAEHKASTVINTSDGYPVKAWPKISNGYLNSDSQFIDNYNKTMSQLIKSKNDSK
jgi:hypothetical protein